MAKYEEQHFNTVFSVLFLLTVFVLIFQPWSIGLKELYWQEGFYATSAMELSNGVPIVSAHGVVSGTSFPLFPLMVRGLYELGVPMAYALRLISIISALGVGIWVFLLGRSAAGNIGGTVAASVWLTSSVVIEKTLDGFPNNTTIFLVMASQFIWFTLGQRNNRWNLAWICSGVFAALAFYCGGGLALLFCYFPFIFHRRPLSIKAKLKYPGAVGALVIIVFTVLLWIIPLTNSDQKSAVTFLSHDYNSYWSHLWEFPIDFAWRLMPWTLIAWPVFCAAYRPLDATPILSRFLRTLFIANFMLLWLSPVTDVRDMVLLFPSLSILIGINYAILARRHGIFYRKILQIFPYLIIVLGMITAGFFLINTTNINWTIEYFNLPDIDLSYRLVEFNKIFGICSGGVIFLGGLYMLVARNRIPLWLAGVFIILAPMLFYWSVTRPFNTNKTPKQIFAQEIQKVMPQESETIYKLNIRGLYGELYYLNQPIQEIDNLNDLPKNEVIYLLTTSFPQLPERSWVKLMEMKLVDAKEDEKALQLYSGSLVNPQTTENMESTQ